MLTFVIFGFRECIFRYATLKVNVLADTETFRRYQLQELHFLKLGINPTE